jgi:hypothetical protein
LRSWWGCRWQQEQRQRGKSRSKWETHADILAENGAGYSTVTDFARLRGWSTSQPRRTAM